MGYRYLKDTNLYVINEEGTVISKQRKGTKGGKMAKFTDQKGYPRVSIYYNGKQWKKLVHRLIAEVFIPNPMNLPFINHIDGNKKNNKIENLEWCTHRENIIHAFSIGLSKGYFKGKFGYEANGNVETFQYSKEGVLINTFGSINEASRQTGIPKGNIIYRLRHAKKLTGDFIWTDKLLA